VWLAHALTLARLPLLAVLWLAHDAWTIAAAVAGAALSDLLDGPVARRAKARRAAPWPAWWAIGGWLDPLVDKVFVGGALAALFVRAHVALWELALVATREVLLVPLLAVYLATRRAHAPLSADVIGKVTTAGQLITLAVLAVAPAGWLGELGAAACAVLGVATIAHYARTR
jgi:phosphatidylglycerophosphate synthase